VAVEVVVVVESEDVEQIEQAVAAVWAVWTLPAMHPVTVPPAQAVAASPGRAEEAPTVEPVWHCRQLVLSEYQFAAHLPTAAV
jgi:hypothetical protein